MKKLLLPCLLLLLASCKPEAKLQVPPHIDAFARSFVDSVRAGNIDQCMQQVAPESATPAMRDYLTIAYHNLQNFGVKSVRCIDATRTADGTGSQYALSYEYTLRNMYLYIQMTLAEKDSTLAMTSFEGTFTEKAR
jgi:hypothetical protein